MKCPFPELAVRDTEKVRNVVDASSLQFKPKKIMLKVETKRGEGSCMRWAQAVFVRRFRAPTADVT